MYAACRGSCTQARLRDSVYVPDSSTGRDPFAPSTAAAAPRQSSFVCATFRPRATQQDDEVAGEYRPAAGRRLDAPQHPGQQQHLGRDRGQHVTRDEERDPGSPRRTEEKEDGNHGRKEQEPQRVGRRGRPHPHRSRPALTRGRNRRPDEEAANQRGQDPRGHEHPPERTRTRHRLERVQRPIPPDLPGQPARRGGENRDSDRDRSQLRRAHGATRARAADRVERMHGKHCREEELEVHGQADQENDTRGRPPHGRDPASAPASTGRPSSRGLPLRTGARLRRQSRPGGRRRRSRPRATRSPGRRAPGRPGRASRRPGRPPTGTEASARARSSRPPPGPATRWRRRAGTGETVAPAAGSRRTFRWLPMRCRARRGTGSTSGERSTVARSRRRRARRAGAGRPRSDRARLPRSCPHGSYAAARVGSANIPACKCRGSEPRSC